jgi:hypothetical protein
MSLERERSASSFPTLRESSTVFRKRRACMCPVGFFMPASTPSHAFSMIDRTSITRCWQLALRERVPRQQLPTHSESSCALLRRSLVSGRGLFIRERGAILLQPSLQWRGVLSSHPQLPWTSSRICAWTTTHIIGREVFSEVSQAATVHTESSVRRSRARCRRDRRSRRASYHQPDDARRPWSGPPSRRRYQPDRWSIKSSRRTAARGRPP